MSGQDSNFICASNSMSETLALLLSSGAQFPSPHTSHRAAIP